LFQVIHFRAKDEVLCLQHALHGRQDLWADGGELRFQIKKRERSNGRRPLRRLGLNYGCQLLSPVIAKN
jgi:hypothetical protein